MPAGLDLRSYESENELVNSVAEYFCEVVKRAKFPDCVLVAFAAGRSIQLLNHKLANLASNHSLNLEGLHCFFADERCVPVEDPHSNFRQLKEQLIEPLKIHPEKVHRIRGELFPSEAVVLANADLRTIARDWSDGLPILDLVILGLGDDGHIASLFSNHGNYLEASRDPFLAINDAPKEPPNRITFSYSILSVAREVWVLAAGKNKAPVIEKILAGRDDLPVVKLIKQRDQTVIFTDACILAITQ